MRALISAEFNLLAKAGIIGTAAIHSQQLTGPALTHLELLAGETPHLVSIMRARQTDTLQPIRKRGPAEARVYWLRPKSWVRRLSQGGTDYV